MSYKSDCIKAHEHFAAATMRDIKNIKDNDFPLAKLVKVRAVKRLEETRKIIESWE